MDHGNCRLLSSGHERWGGIILGEIIRFPGDLITEHDARRLKEAADASPFDLEIREDRRGELIPYLSRCGHAEPSFRLQKTIEGWEAISLSPKDAGTVSANARSANELLRLLSSPENKNPKP